MKYTENEALAKIRNAGAKVSGKTISAKNLGIGTWGAVDYLVNVHKYTLHIV